MDHSNDLTKEGDSPRIYSPYPAPPYNSYSHYPVQPYMPFPRPSMAPWGPCYVATPFNTSGPQCGFQPNHQAIIGEPLQENQMVIPQNLVGHVIGGKGASIKKILEDVDGVNIDFLPPAFPTSIHRIVQINGTKEKVDIAKRLIAMKVQELMPDFKLPIPRVDKIPPPPNAKKRKFDKETSESTPMNPYLYPPQPFYNQQTMAPTSTFMPMFPNMDSSSLSMPQNTNQTSVLPTTNQPQKSSLNGSYSTPAQFFQSNMPQTKTGSSDSNPSSDFDFGQFISFLTSASQWVAYYRSIGLIEHAAYIENLLKYFANQNEPVPPPPPNDE